MALDRTFEEHMQAQGYSTVAGIDEAGRGCWAGAVVAAAVILPPVSVVPTDIFRHVNDSKQLTEHQRERCYTLITTHAVGVGVGIVPAYIIDVCGIVPATRLAMLIALLSLPYMPDALLIDAMTLPLPSLVQQSLIKGDSRCLSIAAASIVAKVTRDHMMHTAEEAYPGYGFAQHKGYGTAQHRRALATHGTCPLHRLSYKPVAALRH